MARNPEEESSLPYLVRLPLPDGAVVLKVRDVWPRTAKVTATAPEGWPDEPDIVERVPVRVVPAAGAPSTSFWTGRGRTDRSSCSPRRAAATSSSGSRRAPAARPDRTSRVPTARAAGQLLEILVDSHERYPWTFGHQQATTRRRALPAGDYAVELDGGSSPPSSASPRRSRGDDDQRQAPLRPRRSRCSAQRRGRRRGPLLGSVQARSRPAGRRRRRPRRSAARFPVVPIVFAETRPLAQEWAYRFLGAAVAHYHDDLRASPLLAALPSAGPVPAPEPTTAEVRAWARRRGMAVTDRGAPPADIWAAFREALPSSDAGTQ